MREISRPWALLVSFLICILCVLVLPVLAEGTGAIDIGSLIPLATANQGYSSPSLSGDSILFFAENSTSGSPDLFCYRITTGKLTLVCQGGRGLDSWSSPRIGGRWIVYTKPHNLKSQNPLESTDVFAFDIDSGREELLGTSFGAHPDVSVYEDIVVWQTGTKDRVWPDLTNTREYFVLYNLSTHTTADIFPQIPDNPEKPVIYKNQLVYAGISDDPGDRNEGRGTFQNDIFCYNISSGKEMQISLSGTAYSPSISGPLIVWEDSRNGNGDIYLYNLSSEEELPLCIDPADQRNPRISGDWVVWEDKRHQPAQPPVTACPTGIYCPVETPLPPVSDIYLYNLTKKMESCISVPMGEPYHISGDNRDPDVSGHRVVWTRYGGLFLYSAMNETIPSGEAEQKPSQAIPGKSSPKCVSMCVCVCI